MRETELIISDSEAATMAVLKGDICLRTGRSGSLSSGTTLCRVSFAVFLLRAPPAERERAHSKCAKTGVGGFRRERGFAMGWKCAWIRRGLVVRRTPSSPALRYHGLQRAVAPPRGGGERRKGWVDSSWLRSEKEFFSSSSAM